MCQSPRAAHHTVAAVSSGFPAKPVPYLLACSTLCAGRWTWQDPAYVLEVLVTGAQYWMWSATRATAEGSIVEVAKHWCFVPRVLPWLCFTCVCCFCMWLLFFFFFSFCCTPELMLLDLAIVFIWDGTTGAPVAHGSWLMSSTALYYMVWCGWAAHSESIFCTRVSFCCLWLPFIDVNSNSLCIWVLIISVLSSHHAHLSQDYGAEFIFLFVVFLFLKSRLCWSFQLNYKNTV